MSFSRLKKQVQFLLKEIKIRVRPQQNPRTLQTLFSWWNWLFHWVKGNSRGKKARLQVHSGNPVDCSEGEKWGPDSAGTYLRSGGFSALG